MERGYRVTAIVCASDLIALIVLRVARSLGLQVPSDLSVVGYGDGNPRLLPTRHWLPYGSRFTNWEVSRFAVQKMIALAAPDS